MQVYMNKYIYKVRFVTSNFFIQQEQKTNLWHTPSSLIFFYLVCRSALVIIITIIIIIIIIP